MIDLRSDTVTQPNATMRRAMADAVVGDDVFQEDPTIQRLEARAAELFERAAALFVPSGSMGNLIAIACHAQRGQEVICERWSHVYRHEMASMSALAGVMPHVLDGDAGVLSTAQIAEAIQPKLDLHAWTGLVTLENTHNLAGGTLYPTARVQEICTLAHERGVPVHMDGARIFNAAVALGETVAAITRGCDSVSFCLSKGLGAPVGSLLVGDQTFIDSARRMRKMLGGGMRQAGILAAAGLIALEDSPARLHVDHANARALAEGIASAPGVRVDPTRVVTNIVMADVSGTGRDAFTFAGALFGHGVMTLPMDAARVRMVTHCDVDRAGIDAAIAAVQTVATEGS